MAVAALVALGLTCVVSPVCAQGAVKPNIIIMLADDMGIGDTSAYLGKQLEAGAPPIALTTKTPNLERLAQMGAVFTDVHSPSSVCSTTRYAMLTGRYAWRSNSKNLVVGSEWTSNPMLDAQRETMATLLGRAGYDTAAVGKWHLGMRMADLNGNVYLAPNPGSPTQSDFDQIRWPTAANPTPAGPAVLFGPNQAGFDYYFGSPHNNDPVPTSIRAFLENDQFVNTLQWNGGPVATNWDITKVGEIEGNKMLDLIDNHAAGAPGSTNPLFMYFAPHANHSPQLPPATMNIQGTNYAVANQAKYTNNADGTARDDMVLQNDIILGALLDKLESTTDPRTGGRMIDNTILIFSSDNGADTDTAISAGGLTDKKRSIYEGGHRVPFLAAWPGNIPPGLVSDQLFGLNDLYATFATLTGVALGPNEAEDSEVILGALKGTAGFQRPGYTVQHDDSMDNDPAVVEIPTGAALAIRSNNYKLIVGSQLVNVPTADVQTGGGGQSIPLAFFDLAADPTETNNLLGNPAYASIIEQMRVQVLKYHNQGFSRSTIQQPFGPLLQTDGGTDLNNSFNGALGYEFTVGASPVTLTRLGMWDDAAADIQFQETNGSNPDGDTVGVPDGLATAHWIRLFDKTSGQQIAAIQLTNGNSVVEGEFRYANLAGPVVLYAGREYALTMSTQVGDGDMYHSPVAGSGTSPIFSSSFGDFQPRLSSTDGVYPTLRPGGVTATGAATESIYEYRLFAGPTATVAQIPTTWVDFNSDLRIDGADFLIWQRGLGLTNATRAQGDADGNGVVDGLDLSLWRAVYAAQVAAGVGVLAAVPEPATWTLALVAVAAATRRRRRAATTRTGT